MKKVFIAACLLTPLFSMATTTENPMQSENTIVSCSEAVVFRSVQRLRSSDNYSIYLYPSGKVQWYAGDRLIVESTYSIQGNEVQFFDEYGNTLYKASFTYTSDRRNIASLVLQGTRYSRI